MIIQRIEETASKYPDKTAIIYKKHQVTYAELSGIINKLANGFSDAGIRRQDRILVLMPNFPHFIFSYYALLKLGAVVVPVNYMHDEADLNHVLNNAQAGAIIYWSGFRTLLSDFFISATDGSFIRIVLGDSTSEDDFQLLNVIADSPDKTFQQEINADDLSLIQYTQGNSDFPVGVELSHGNISESVKAFVNDFSLSENDVCQITLPLFLIVNQNVMLNSALIRGAAVVLHDRLDIESVIESLRQHQSNVLLGTPSFYSALADTVKEPFSNSTFKYCISTFDKLDEELAARFNEKVGAPLLNAYSVTDIGGIVASALPSDPYRIDSVGLPLSGIDIQMHDANGEQVDINEVGEIAIRGGVVPKGYWQNETLADERIKDGWFYPGDFGTKNANGFIHLVEKKANVILKSGFKIYASEIEDVLKKHEKVREATVISIPHPDHKEDVLACVVLNNSESMSEQEIFEFCRDQMPVYKCPQVIKFYDKLPRTKMGRVFKRKLRHQNNK